MNKLMLISLSTILIGCSSTGVIPMDEGRYMIAQRSVQVGFGPPDAVKAEVYKEANEFCKQQGKTVKTENLQVTDSGFARPGNVSLEFSCQ
jgi:hypothetical protein